MIFSIAKIIHLGILRIIIFFNSNNMEVNLLDKICVLDAKTVTKKEFEQTLGMSREEYLKEMRRFVEEQQRVKAAAESK